MLDLDARVVIAERTLQTRMESLDIIQARFDRGTVALIDVNQAEIEKYDAQAQLVALMREDVQVENLLSILLGQHPGAVIHQRRDISSMEPLRVPSGMPSELLERRPDIRVA